MSKRIGRIDLHMHSTVSDGTDTPQALPELVRAAGITVFSVTDHDAVKACRIIRDVCTPDDPAFIPGVEFSCKDAHGKYHILGYGFDLDAPAVNGLVSRGHSLRVEKARARLEYLQAEFGFSFPEQEVERLLALDNPGKPHIANLMIRCGYAGSIGEAISDYINRLRYHGRYIAPQDAVEGILASGGIPVLAHPWFGSGSERIDSGDMQQRLRRLTDYGLKGVEAFYSGFSASQTQEMLSLSRQFDLYVTAGSDYHGTNKTVRLGDTGLDDTAEYPEGLKRFLDVCQTR